jgi:hypothetical protein
MIETCANCGGTHIGSVKCPYTKAACVICGTPTILACSDCAIDSGGRNSVHVCSNSACRDQHEKIHAEPCPYCGGDESRCNHDWRTDQCREMQPRKEGA